MSDLSNFVNELQSVASIASIASIASVSQKSIKLLIVSTHVNQVNGYSKVVFNLLQQLATNSWIDIVHFGTQKMLHADLGRAYPSRVKVIDATALEKDKTPGFALAELPGVIAAEKPDVVFLYNDLSVICAYIENIRKSIERRSFKIWAYVDLCYASPSSAMIDILNRDVERVFCFTKSWKEAIKSQGITRPVDVLPHAADPAMFRILPKDLARQQLGLPKDVFLFTSLNKNIPRKRLDLWVISFVKLITRFPTKPIFGLVVADKGENGGFSLFEIFAREIKLHGGSVEMFGNRLMITSKDTCYRDEDINMLYNCADVNLSCAEGEGFGLCSFESMSVGIPQIVPEINGYTEYCQPSHSLLVKPSMRLYVPQAFHSVTGEAQLVDPESVSKAMERYVFDEDLRKLHSRLGKEKASEYTWAKAAATLVKRLKALQEEEE